MMVASVEAGIHNGTFYDGEGLFGRGQTGMQQLGLCILDKVGVIISIFNWGEDIHAFLRDLQADTAACCTTSARLQEKQEEGDTGFCCFGRSCCDGGSGSRAKPGDWCDGSRTQCMSCAGQPTWCKEGNKPRKSAKEWCLSRLKLGYSILHKLAEGTLSNRSSEDGESANKSLPANHSVPGNRSNGSNLSSQDNQTAAGERDTRGSRKSDEAGHGDEGGQANGTNTSANSSTTVTNATNTTGSSRRSPLCHDAIKGEQCYNWTAWAHKHGMREHPEWYAPWGLNQKSTKQTIQANLWLRGEGHCSLPCSGHVDVSTNDLIGAYAGHLLAAARDLLGGSAPINGEAKGLLARCAAFPRMPCNRELDIPKTILL